MKLRAEKSEEDLPIRVRVKKLEGGQWPVTRSEFRVTATQGELVLARKEGFYFSRIGARRGTRKIWKSEGKNF